MAFAKKAKRFVKYLAKNLNEGGLPSTSEQELNKAFLGALDSLPDAELRQEFRENFKNYFEKFQKLCLSYVAANGRTEKEMELDVATTENVTVTPHVSIATPNYPYNLYSHKPNHVHIPESCTHQEKKEIYLCFLSKKIGVLPDEKVLRILDDIKGSDTSSKLSWLQDLQFLSNLLLSNQSGDVLYRIMMITSRKLIDNVESVLSGKKCLKKSSELCNYLGRLLYLFHCKHEALGHPVSQCSPSYSDLMAAMLSVYVDLLLTVSSRLEGKEHALEAKRLCVFCVYLLRGYPFHVCDVLAQLGGMTRENADILHPLIRKTLMRQTPTSSMDYTKYMCTLRLLEAAEVLPEEVIQHASRVRAPADFLEWLEEQDASLLEEMPVTKQFHGNAITSFLLHAEMELINSLLECIVTGSPEAEERGAADQKETMDTQLAAPQSEEAAAVMEDSTPMFFIDKKGLKEDSMQNGDFETTEDSDVEIDEAELDRLMKSSDESDQEDVSSDDGDLEMEEEKQPPWDSVPSVASPEHDIFLQTEEALSLVLDNSSVEDEDMTSPSPATILSPTRDSRRKKTTSETLPSHDGPKSPDNAKPVSPAKSRKSSMTSPARSPARAAPLISSTEDVDKSEERPTSRRRTRSHNLSESSSVCEDVTAVAAEDSQQPPAVRGTRSKQRKSVGKLGDEPAADCSTPSISGSGKKTRKSSEKKRKSGSVIEGLDSIDKVMTRAALTDAANAALRPQGTPPALRTVHLRVKKKLGLDDVYDFHSDTDSPMARGFHKKIEQAEEFQNEAMQKAAAKSTGIISRTRTSSRTLRTSKLTDEDDIHIPTPTRVTSFPMEELVGSTESLRTRKRTSSKSPASKEDEKPLKRLAIDGNDEDTTGHKARRKSRGTGGDDAPKRTPLKDAQQAADPSTPSVHNTRHKTPIKQVDQEVSFKLSPGKASPRKTPASAQSTRRRSGAVTK